jgi:hypothetical protein
MDSAGPNLELGAHSSLAEPRSENPTVICKWIKFRDTQK